MANVTRLITPSPTSTISTTLPNTTNEDKAFYDLGSFHGIEKIYLIIGALILCCCLCLLTICLAKRSRDADKRNRNDKLNKMNQNLEIEMVNGMELKWKYSVKGLKITEKDKNILKSKLSIESAKSNGLTNSQLQIDKQFKSDKTTKITHNPIRSLHHGSLPNQYHQHAKSLPNQYNNNNNHILQQSPVYPNNNHNHFHAQRNMAMSVPNVPYINTQNSQNNFIDNRHDDNDNDRSRTATEDIDLAHQKQHFHNLNKNIHHQNIEDTLTKLVQSAKRNKMNTPVSVGTSIAFNREPTENVIDTQESDHDNDSDSFGTHTEHEFDPNSIL